MGKLFRNQHGFTLIELMVVAAIIVTLAAISVPEFSQRSRGYRMNAAARDLQSKVQGARMEAVKRGVDVWMDIDLAGDQCTTFVDDGATASVLDSSDTIIGYLPLPEGVDLFATDSGGPAIQFSSRGTLSIPAGTERILMQNVDGLLRGVRIRITGNSVIVKSSDGGATWYQ